MALRKNQLRKMQLEEIMQLVQQEIDSDNLKLIHTFVHDKNEALNEKKSLLLGELEKVRKGIEKGVYNLNNRAKDRLDKKEKIVMDKDSRPKTEDMTALMDLFAYHERQGAIMDRNHQDIASVKDKASQKYQQLENQSKQRAAFDQLDRQYAELNQICQQEEIIRNNLIKDRNSRRNHYAAIASNIEQCRKDYDVVENNIKDRQRELIQLITYYEARQSEDNALLVELPAKSISFEEEILAAQQRLAHSEQLLQDRIMRTIQGHGLSLL